MSPLPAVDDRFRLTRWFGAVALALIAAIAAASVWLLSWFVSERMLDQEGALTRDFVQSLVLVELPLQTWFANPGVAPPPDVQASFLHFAHMPDVLRANVYDRERTVMWSSDSQLIGRRFGPNNELDEALAGAVVVEKKTDAERQFGKAEYESLAQQGDLFVEIYVPVLDSQTQQVVGAIEFYKNPRSLMQSLAQLRLYIVAGAVGFALLLFSALFGLVRRADRTMLAQERRLVDNESFAVVGEMSSVVAHGIRNPLAAIRSSAELIVELAPSDRAVVESARDIVQQSDRLGAWVRELLSYTRPADGRAQPLALTPLVRSCLLDLERELQRRHIGTRTDLAEDLPTVQGDAMVVGQVLRSVLANAMEALPEGGQIALRAEVDASGRRLTLRIEDNGPGMDRAQRERVGKPFFTTKPNGMGVGLALARRVLERSGGALLIDSEPGRGTVVSIALRTA
jgi:signal transduction histidine kinase